METVDIAPYAVTERRIARLTRRGPYWGITCLDQFSVVEKRS